MISSTWRLWAWVAIALHFLILLFLGLSRHWAYLTSLNDLGVFDQAVWGTMQGDWFLNTSNHFSKPLNWLGFHFNLILLAFVPLYWVNPSPEWFALVQALALSLAAWPIFLFASNACQSERSAFIWALVYLFNPLVLNAAAWDFHPVSLAVPFVALGMFAIAREKRSTLFCCCLALLLIQEQMGLTVAGLGVLWGVQTRKWLPGVILVVLGIAHAFLILGVVMPAFSLTNNHWMLAAGNDSFNRYGWLGHSFIEIGHNLVTRPLAVLRIVMFDMGGAWYLMLLLLPLLGLPLAAPAMLLPGLSDLAANLLSSNPMPRSMMAYHNAVLVAVFTIAAIDGCQRICRWNNFMSLLQWAGLVLMSSFILGYKWAPFPLPLALNAWQPRHFPYVPEQGASKILSAIGSNSSVSAQANVGSHFSQRREIYVFPEHIDSVDFIVLRLESPTSRLTPTSKESLGTFAHHLQMDSADYIATVDCILRSGKYGVVIWESPWLLLSPKVRVDSTRIEEVSFTIEALKKEWRVGESSRISNACLLPH